MVSGIIGMFFAALPVFLTYFFGLPFLPTIRILACMLAAAALIMYRISCASNYIIEKIKEAVQKLKFLDSPAGRDFFLPKAVLKADIFRPAAEGKIYCVF